MPVHTHYWKPYRPAREYAEKLATDVLAENKDALIVDVGPGAAPFALANAFVGRWVSNMPSDMGELHPVDLSVEALPYDDDQVDFLYCRHTLEDLDSPALFLSEVSRVAKAGYIETPSPIAELCRGVDCVPSGAAEWRGYHHHRSIVWNDNGTLSVIAKWPYLEHIQFDDEVLAEVLNGSALHWNTYFAWSGPFAWKYYQHECDYKIGPKYAEMMEEAIRASYASTMRAPWLNTDA